MLVKNHAIMSLSWSRIGVASKVIGAMRSEVLERRELKQGKVKVFNAMVVASYVAVWV